MTKEELNAQWPSLVQDGKPTEAFWLIWREQKAELKSLGVVVTKQEAGDYTVDLSEKTPKPAGLKLLTLTGIPTLGEFGEMTSEQVAAWVDEHPKEAKILGLSKNGYGGVALAGISSLGLRQSACWWSNKQADYMASALKRLDRKPCTVNNRHTEDQALALWRSWQQLPLNELKFMLVNETQKGLRRYFNPEARAARDRRAAHNYLMANDPDYAFYVIKSKCLGEFDALEAEGIPVSKKEKDEFERFVDSRGE